MITFAVMFLVAFCFMVWLEEHFKRKDPKCFWKQSEYDVSSWTSSCRESFLMAHYDIANYCSNCGGRLIVELTEDIEDEG